MIYVIWQPALAVASLVIISTIALYCACSILNGL
jgi:hypothetical protein